MAARTEDERAKARRRPQGLVLTPEERVRGQKSPQTGAPDGERVERRAPPQGGLLPRMRRSALQPLTF